MQMKFKYKILHELKFNKIFKETCLERVTQHVWKELHNMFGKSYTTCLERVYITRLHYNGECKILSITWLFSAKGPFTGHASCFLHVKHTFI